jgi:PE family
VTLGRSPRRSEVGISFVIAVPEYVTAAASDLANVGSTIDAANAAAAAPTSALVAAGGDEVSAAVATAFGAHAQAYQALSAEATAFHQQFVELLNAGAASYAGAEAANANPLKGSSTRSMRPSTRSWDGP